MDYLSRTVSQMSRHLHKFPLLWCFSTEQGEKLRELHKGWGEEGSGRERGRESRQRGRRDNKVSGVRGRKKERKGKVSSSIKNGTTQKRKHDH